VRRTYIRESGEQIAVGPACGPTGESPPLPRRSWDLKNDAAHILVSEEIVAGELQVVLVGPHATRFEPDAQCEYARSLGSNLLDDGIDRYFIASQIDDDVAVRLRAANENVPVGRFVERLRSVDDRPRN